MRNVPESLQTAHASAHIRLRAWGLVPLGVLALGACAVEETPVDTYRGAATVSSFVNSSCSTSVVLGLSTQIAQEVDCMMPGTLTSFTEGGGIDFTGSAVLPYIAPEAKADLEAAVAAYGGTIQINSAYRTVVQQYLLYRWWQEGRCGITAAATPGSSNHETGRALDVNNHDTWRPRLENHGWDQSVPGDPVHFDHLGSPDLRGADVLAFQRLWNRNHPEDPIAEDGDYGPQTAARLASSPAEGFPVGPCPAEPPGPEWAAAAGAVELPAEMTSGERVVAWIEFQNTGSQGWKIDSTRLGTLDPMDHPSAFFDEENWLSPSRASGVDHATAPGDIGRFTFMIKAPDVAVDTVISETFGVVEEGVAWLDAPTVTIEILVRPSATTPPVGELPEDPVDDGSMVSGGCSTGGDTSGNVAWVLVMAAMWVAVRIRRTVCSLGEARLFQGGHSCAGSSVHRSRSHSSPSSAALTRAHISKRATSGSVAPSSPPRRMAARSTATTTTRSATSI